MNILGIETSCDETAAAIVGGDRAIRANLVLSQLEEHRLYGGVVPEIAARAHLDHLDRLIAAALEEAGLGLDGIDAVAATCGPGLIGGVLVGMMTGKAIAAARGLPFIAVNHLEAHALTPRLTAEIAFPYLVLLVSGGHSQILAAEGVGSYKLYGTTIDDAAGECFDKAAKLMGLPWPGGPHLEKLAARCADPEAALARFPLPRPLRGKPGCDFSFSGLKTAVRTHAQTLAAGDEAARADLACSVQRAIAAHLADRCKRGLERFRKEYGAAARDFVVCGGVAANAAIRQALTELAAAHGMTFSAPPVKLCSDNAAMIAWAGAERLKLGLTDPLTAAARPRWPLEELKRSAA
jgi:N6-L-threonylcarbamoyladenine synthase